MSSASNSAAERPWYPGLLRIATPFIRPFRGRSLRASALRSSAWTIGGYGASQVIRLASNLTLTRLLFPEAFGWMLPVLTITQGLQMFSDVGIGALVIQSKRGEDQSFLDTVWTVQIIRGFLLWLVALAIAAPAAAFFNEPQILWLLPLVGLQLVAGGFQSMSYFTANRHLRLGRLTGIQLVAQTVSAVVMILWALQHESVLALAVGAVLTPAITSIMTHVALPGKRHRLRWEREAASELFHFGKWIFVSTLLTFLAMQSDRLIFARLTDAETLGVYAIAVNLAMLGISILNRLSGRVLHPAYSRLVDRGEPLAGVLPRVRIPSGVFAAAAASGLAACAFPLVAIMYDPRYIDASWMLRILACSVILQSLDLTLNKALLAMGRPQDLAILNGARLIGLATFLPIGYHHAGMPGALVGIVLADVLRYATTVTLAKRQGLPALSHDLPVIGYAVAVVAIVLMLGEWIGWTRFGEVPALALSAGVCGLLWLPWIPTVLKRLRKNAGIFKPAAAG